VLAAHDLPDVELQCRRTHHSSTPSRSGAARTQLSRRPSTSVIHPRKRNPPPACEPRAATRRTPSASISGHTIVTRNGRNGGSRRSPPDLLPPPRDDGFSHPPVHSRSCHPPPTSASPDFVILRPDAPNPTPTQAPAGRRIYNPGREKARVCRRAGFGPFGLRMPLRANEFRPAGLRMTIRRNCGISTTRISPSPASTPRRGRGSTSARRRWGGRAGRGCGTGPAAPAAPAGRSAPCRAPRRSSPPSRPRSAPAR